MDITIFKDIKQTSQPFYRDVNLILDRIRDGASKDLVKKIRSEKEKDTRKILKAKLKLTLQMGSAWLLQRSIQRIDDTKIRVSQKLLVNKNMKSETNTADGLCLAVLKEFMTQKFVCHGKKI